MCSSLAYRGRAVGVQQCDASLLLVRCPCCQVCVESRLMLDTATAVEAMLSQDSIADNRSGGGDSAEGWVWMTLTELHRRPALQAAADYFSACVLLYYEMCLNRNYVCIAEISHMFPRGALYAGTWACLLRMLCRGGGTTVPKSATDIVVHCSASHVAVTCGSTVLSLHWSRAAIVNQQLPDCARAELLQLLMVLYVDVKPHTTLPVAERTRLWKGLHQRRCAAFSPSVAFNSAHTAEEQQWFVSVAGFAKAFLARRDGECSGRYRIAMAVVTTALRPSSCSCLVFAGALCVLCGCAWFQASWCRPSGRRIK